MDVRGEPSQIQTVRYQVHMDTKWKTYWKCTERYVRSGTQQDKMHDISTSTNRERGFLSVQKKNPRNLVFISLYVGVSFCVLSQPIIQSRMNGRLKDKHTYRTAPQTPTPTDCAFVLLIKGHICPNIVITDMTIHFFPRFRT